MMRISIRTPPGKPDAGLVKAISKITKAPIGEIYSALLSGAPLFEDEIIGNRTRNAPAEIRGLLSLLENKGLPVLVYENGDPIRSQVVLNFLEASDARRKEIAELDDLGHMA